jgi:polar amino acid transport system substrate-binding protein
MRSTEASLIYRHKWLLLLLAFAAPAMAEERRAGIRAVAGVIPPLVMKDQAQLTGFSIELWKAIAAKLGAETSYRIVPDINGLFDALRTGESDIVIVGVY